MGLFQLTPTLQNYFEMSEELLWKKSLRAAHRAGGNRIVNQVGDLLGAQTVDPDELTLLQTNLFTKSKPLEALDAQIVDLTPNAELEEEIVRAEEYLEKIQRALLKIHKALRATPTQTGLRADATHEPVCGGPTDEATGHDPRVSVDRDKHGTEFAHERTGPPY